MLKVEEGDKSSESASEDLQDEDLANINQHFRKTSTARGCKMTAEIEAVYKDALVKSFFGKYRQATQKLKYIISLYPSNPEPYHLIGNMYLELKQLDKAVEYFFMSTYFSVPNFDKWVKVGDMSFEAKMYRQACYCYGRALKIENYNVELMQKRAECFELLLDFKKAIVLLKKILKLTPSTEVVKQMAKLYFQRNEFPLARESLMGIPNYEQDVNVINMICETYLKQRKYADLETLVQRYYQHDPTILSRPHQLPIEFLKFIYLCRLSPLSSSHQDPNQIPHLRTLLQDQYSEDHEAFYDEIFTHLKELNTAEAASFAEPLLENGQFNRVDTLLYLSEHFIQSKELNRAVKVLKEGLLEHPRSTQLLVKLKYLQLTMSPSKKPKQKHAFRREGAREGGAFSEEDIYYSEDSQNAPFDSHSLIEPKKGVRSSTSQLQNSTHVGKLLQETYAIFQSINLRIETEEQKETYYYQDVLKALELLVNLNPTPTAEKKPIKSGLYMKETSDRRRRCYRGRQSLTLKFFTINIDLIIQICVQVANYLCSLLAVREYQRVKIVSEILSKTYFFRLRSSNEDLKESKLRIYELGLLSCLFLKKYNVASYFARHLLQKASNEPLYLMMTHYLLKKTSGGRINMGSVIGKLLKVAQANNSQFLYLAALHYMDNGCFDLAITSLLKTSRMANLEHEVALCLSSCLLQIASSRNTTNKMRAVNASSYWQSEYVNRSHNRHIAAFNTARWYCQVSLNDKAVHGFQGLLEDDQVPLQLQQKSAYCLIWLYRQMGLYEQGQKLSQVYFGSSEP